MEFLQHKRTGAIFAVRSITYIYGNTYYKIQQQGSRGTLDIRETQINKTLKKYNPSFFRKLYFYFIFR